MWHVILVFRMETVKPWKQSSHTMVKRLSLTGLLFFQTLMRRYLHLSIKLFYLRQGEFLLFQLNRCLGPKRLFCLKHLFSYTAPQASSFKSNCV